MDVQPFTIIYSAKSADLLLPAMLRVSLNKEHNMKKLHVNCMAEVETTWKECLRINPRLFNGTKFRLESLEEGTDNTLALNLGVTCYKDLQGTNVSDNALILQSQGLCDHDNSQAYMADALGVGALVETSDNCMVLLLRSQHCGEDRGVWDRPGGHAEPKEIVGDMAMEDIDPAAMSSEAVVAEIYSSITREVTEEVNIPPTHLSQPAVLGLSRSNTTGGKPNIEFLIRCSLSSNEVESLYKQGSQVDAFESEQVQLLPLDQAVAAHRDNTELWNKMAPGAKGLITLYNMYKHRFLL